MEELKKINNVLKYQIAIVDDILTQYVNDEAGKESKKQFKSMSDLDKIKLLTITLLTCSSWEDFQQDIITNFDYQQYNYNKIKDWK
jgi:hypothetical protein